MMIELGGEQSSMGDGHHLPRLIIHHACLSILATNGRYFTIYPIQIKI
jgi:hypothetical protein